LAFAPAIGFAAEANLSGVQKLVDSVGGIINSLLPVLFALALVYFFWGLIVFIRAAGDAKKVEEGRGIMIYGIIALAVMVSVYGLIGWLQTTLGIQPTTQIQLPGIPTR